MIHNSYFSLFQIQIIQVSILVLLVGLVSRFLRDRHPHIAYALWLVVFVKCLTPPVMATPFGLFAWQSSPESIQSTPSDETVDLDSDRVADRETAPAFESPRFSLREVQPVVPGLRLKGLTNAVVKNVQPKQETVGPVVQSGKRLATNVSKGISRVPQRLSGSLAAMIIWMVGIAVIFMVSIGQWIRCWKIIQGTRIEPNDRLRAVVRNVKQKLGYYRNVKIIVTESDYGPMVFGYLHPVLILPKQLVDESESIELEPLIAHELIHVRRGDTLMSLLQFVATTVCWFNPLIWWANRQTNLTCERCCDLEVVDGLKCKPTRYARTLLSVVESRRLLKGVVATAGIRASEVTSRRLEWLASQEFTSRRSSQKIGWVASVIAALLVFPAVGIGAPQEDDAAKPPPRLQSVENDGFGEAHLAFNRQEWGQAADLFQSSLNEQPNNAVAWFRMGYALHSLGRLDEAVVAHEKASEFPATKRTGFYNWACALCLMEKYDEAIDKLTAALDAGFALPRPIEQDPDFKGLLEDDRFQVLVLRHKEIVKSQPPTTRRSGFGLATADPSLNVSTVRNQLNFLEGEWTVTSSDGIPVGTSTISRQENGHMIHEDFSGSSGLTGQSFSYFDPVNKKWVQNRVDSTGRIVNLSGTVVGKTINLTGSSTLKIGMQAECRMTMTELKDGRLRQTIEISKDDGSTWTKTFEGFFERRLSSEQTEQDSDN